MNETMFAAVCYHVLTSGNQHPTYLLEKSWVLNAGWEAWAALDNQNQERVREYLGSWNMQLPTKLGCM